MATSLTPVPAAGKGIPYTWFTSLLTGLNAVENRPRAALRNSTTQLLATATVTAITFDSEDFDAGDGGGLHSTISNTSRVTIPSGYGGLYLFIGKISYAPNATGLRVARLQKNGAVVSTQVTQGAINAGFPQALEVSAILSLAAGDYVELAGYQDSGGNLNTGDAATRQLQNEFMVVQLL